MITQAAFVDLLRSNCDPGWIDPLLDDADSAAVINALAKIAERMSIAVDHASENGQIMLASGGSPGTTVLTLSRTTGGAGTLPKGTTFVDDRGLIFVTLDDALFAPAPATLTVVVTSLRKIELVNSVDGPDIRFAPTVLVADASNAAPIVIKTSTPHKYVTGNTVRIKDVTGNTAANRTAVVTVIDAQHFSLNGSTGNGVYLGGGLAQLAPFGFSVLSADPVTGAAVDWLSVIGRERGVVRQTGEAVGQYRARIRNVPDAVSPRAIAQAAQGAAQAQGIPFVEVLEPFDDGSTALLDANLGLGSFPSLYLDSPNPSLAGVPVGWAWDDPAAIILDRRTADAYFKLVTVNPLAISDPDAGRAFWDNMFLDDPFYGFPDLIDHPKVIAALMAIMQAVDTKRAAAVQFDFDLTPYLTYPTAVVTPSINTSSSAGGFTQVWSIAPPTGTVWWVDDVLAARQPPAAGTVPATSGLEVKVTFEDATIATFVQPDGDPSAFHLHIAKYPAMITKRATQVDVYVRSDTITALHAVCVLRVLEVPA